MEQLRIIIASLIKMKYALRLNQCILLLIILFLNSVLYSATKTWDGGGANNNWQTAANWDSDVAPVAGDDLIFSGSTRTSPSNDFAGGTSFASITFAVGASSFSLSGNAVTITGGASAITANNTSNTVSISINLTFSTAAPTITSTSGGTLNISGTINNGGYDISVNCGGTQTFSGVISGTGGFNKSGSGTMTMSAAHTFTGTFTHYAGIVTVGNNSGFGAGSVVMNGTGRWNLNSGVTVSNALTVTSADTQSSGLGMIRANSGTVTWAGTIAANADVATGGYFSSPAAANCVVSGVITGAASVNINVVQNNLTVSGGGTYDYFTVCKGGNTANATLGATNGISTSAILDNAGTGTLDMAGYNQTVAGITKTSGTLAISSGSAATLNINGSTSCSFSGTITGSISLVKSGSNTQTLSGANTYTGTTTITAGTLQLGAAGVISNSSDMVLNGGTFSSGSGAGYSETVGTLTLNASSSIALGTGSHSINFGASDGTSWTGSALIEITGWQGGYDGTSGTSGKIYTGSSAELSAGKLSQIYFKHPVSSATYTATQLADGEIVPTSVLPVKLISFTAEKKVNVINLKWITASEINSDYFEVLRSFDGENFESIGMISAAGNSNQFKYYSFVDNEVSGTVYYKLIQYDFDGSSEESKVVAVIVSGISGKLNIYPNPNNGNFTVSFLAQEAGMYYLRIFKMSGKVIYHAMVACNQGLNKFDISVPDSDRDYYIIDMKDDINESYSAKFIKE